MIYKCKDCKYCRLLKHNFKQGIGFEESKVCVLWEYIEPVDEHTWLLETDDDSVCEMWALRHGTDNKQQSDNDSNTDNTTDS